jgi:soluble lytic murein transglycosylase-like protein
MADLRETATPPVSVESRRADAAEAPESAEARDRPRPGSDLAELQAWHGMSAHDTPDADAAEGGALDAGPTERPVLDAALEARLRALAPMIVAAATAHGLDPVQVAAQCFQESRFDPRARSDAGAVGLMQLMPATAREMGVRDRLDPRENLEGGCRYMRWLAANFFDEPALTPAERQHFCLAAYNAGAGAVRAWRAAAREEGLDADRWFGQVERVARARGVRETVEYVARIERYATEFRVRYGGWLRAR